MRSNQLAKKQTRKKKKKSISLVPEFYVLQELEPAVGAVCFRNKHNAG
jgi:hypothetical protein